MQIIIDGRESPLPSWFSQIEPDATINEFVVRLAAELKAQNKWVRDFEHAGGDTMLRCRAVRIVTEPLDEVIERVKTPLAESVRSAQAVHREAARELRDPANDIGAAFTDAIEFWKDAMDAIDLLAQAGQFDADQFNDERIEGLLVELTNAANAGDRKAAAEVMDELADEAARMESLI